MKPTKQRFEEKFRVTPGCWEWIACSGVSGYGTFWLGGGMQYAHRVSYEMYVGSIPAGMIICHLCDNPKCVNPHHLLIGTNKDKTQDMIAKGRRRQKRQDGLLNPVAKLSDDEVRLVRSGSEKPRVAARKYGLSASYVWDLRVGRARKDVLTVTSAS
jgi:hypothetical protein